MPGSNFFPDRALGGFTNVLALAGDEDEYRQRVAGFFADEGVEFEEVDDVEPLAERLRVDPSLHDEFLELAVTLSELVPVVHQGTIYSYTAEDEANEEG